MTHKEEMKYLKENDPITYYELTSDSTGSDNDDGCFVLVIVLFIILLFILHLLFN